MNYFYQTFSYLLYICLMAGTYMKAFAQDQCAPVGWATQNGGTTGGGSAAPVTVTTISQLQTEAKSGSAKVIYVSGVIGSGVNTRVVVSSNKTIIGLPGAKLIGGMDIKDAKNVIVRNLIIQGPGAVDVDGVDCMTIQNSTNVWVDHMEIYDGQDGNLDVVNGSNYVSITWCKFHYTSASKDHMFSNLIGNSDSKTSDRGKLKVTMQYNWWATGVKERMPRVRFGEVHVVNNLFDSPNSSSCVRAGKEANLLVEGNVFRGVKKPVDLYNNDFTAVTSKDNLFFNTSGNQAGSGNSFSPPYSLAKTPAAQVEALVKSKAGATLAGPDCGGEVSNKAPEVSLESPANGSAYTAPASVNLSAKANDPDGTIERVEFWSNGAMLSSDNSSPYSFAWNNIGAGDYSVYAKAFDNKGASTQSAIIQINVKNAPDKDCNGVAGGSAYLDECGVCVGGNTGKNPCTPSSGNCILTKPSFELAGYASMNGGTTGGKGGEEVTVATGTDLQNAIKNKGDNPLVIYVNGTITPANSPGLSKIDIKDASDISIIGIGVSGEFNGIGIKIWRARNIIIQNVKIHHVLTGDKDCISIDGPSSHIWIDHCELYNEYEGVGKDYYDGLLDAKGESEYITYSWNYLHNSWKASLVGNSESDTYDRKITYHHNYFENINSRLPLFRGGSGHLFNNYYKDIKETGINARINACLKIENNYFENVTNPYVTAYSDIDGYGDISGNILVNSPFKYSSDERELKSCAAVVPYQYGRYLNCAEAVKSIVTIYAGIGKLDGSVNQPPTAHIATPSTGTIFSLEGPIQVKVSASDPDGYVSKVELYSNDQLIETSSSAPYDFQWRPSTTGIFVLSAKVYDNQDASSFSSSVIVEIAGPSGPSDCHGDLDGDATIDQCGVCSGGNTGKMACEGFMEAEYACNLDGEWENKNGGYSGTGYLNTTNTIGSFIEWAIETNTEKTYTLAFRYANSGDADRPASLIVNEVMANPFLNFPSTSAWDVWHTVTVDLKLAAGHNLLRMEAISDGGCANIDLIAFYDPELNSGQCIVTSVTNPENEPPFYHPNPFVETLSINHQGNFTYTITNISGFIVEQGSGTDNARAGARLESGLYLLKFVNDSGETKTLKIIKK